MRRTSLSLLMLLVVALLALAAPVLALNSSAVPDDPLQGTAGGIAPAGPNNTSFTPEALAAVAGVLLSLGMSYVPGLSDIYAQLSGTVKQLVMAVLLLIAAVGTVLWSCSGSHDAGFGMCVYGANWKAVVTGFIFALMANQTTHRITPQKDSLA